MTESTASGSYTEIPEPLWPAAWITLVNHRTPQKQIFFNLKNFSCHPVPQISKHQYNRHYKILNYPRAAGGTDFVLTCYLNIIILWLFTDLFDISNLIKKKKKKQNSPIWKKRTKSSIRKTYNLNFHGTWVGFVCLCFKVRWKKHPLNAYYNLHYKFSCFIILFLFSVQLSEGSGMISRHRANSPCSWVSGCIVAHVVMSVMERQSDQLRAGDGNWQAKLRQADSVCIPEDPGCSSMFLIHEERPEAECAGVGQPWQ